MTTELFLVLRSPDIPRNEWLLTDGEHIVGRSKRCDIVIFDGTISREHANISVENGVVRIIDLRSRNGTHIDGDRLASEEVVCVGSTVRFGRIECVLADTQMLHAFADSERSTLQYQRKNRVKRLEDLSEAERRVLPFLLEGLAEKEVATRLDLSSNTVHHHIGAIYRNLEVSSRGELLALLLHK